MTNFGSILLLTFYMERAGARENVPGEDPEVMGCNVGSIGVTGAARSWVGR